MLSKSSCPDTEITYPDWKSLTDVLLKDITRRLTSIYDYLAVRSVCGSWRSAATRRNFNHNSPQVSLLMYDASGEDNKVVPGRCIHLQDLSRGRTFKIHDFLPFPATVHLSSGGWILYVRQDCPSVGLINPICGRTLELPGLDTFPIYREGENPCIFKMLLSGSPGIDDDVIVTVIWGKEERKQLGFSSPGAPRWEAYGEEGHSICDVTYHNGKLYALDMDRKLVECDIHSPNRRETLKVIYLNYISVPISTDQVPFYRNRYEYYLVESSGKLLAVFRRFSIYNIIRFEVFEVDLMKEELIMIQDLGDKTMFLGLNSSFCLELPDCDAIKSNCIYFTDHFVESSASKADH
ncbi:probable F-box protein At1g44080 isoform X2 [Andrographis paniculata]|uniref:probable F-box protein At1g44080 isoform X2 n=1 Tax=Andrographis paniculata TaxID=175694 RepID=UPI0021E7E8A7|nr:probable F-box protein At1g44080 isoform X2 [Andrographis paniculata]